MVIRNKKGRSMTYVISAVVSLVFVFGLCGYSDALMVSDYLYNPYGNLNVNDSLEIASDLIMYGRIYNPLTAVTINDDFVVLGTGSFDSIRVGSQGVGGVTFFNGTIVNATTDSEGNGMPVTFGDDVMIDGALWRNAGDFKLKDGVIIKGNAYPWTNLTYDLGTSSKKWKNVYAQKFVGSEINIAGVETINSTIIGNWNTAYDWGDHSSAGYLFSSGDTATGDYDFTEAVLQGGNPLVFDGVTMGSFNTTLAVVDPTANNMITLQNASGTLAFLSDIVGGSGGTLDTAYDFGGAGAGRTITVDAGAVQLAVDGNADGAEGLYINHTINGDYDLNNALVTTLTSTGLTAGKVAVGNRVNINSFPTDKSSVTFLGNVSSWDSSASGSGANMYGFALLADASYPISQDFDSTGSFTGFLVNAKHTGGTGDIIGGQINLTNADNPVGNMKGLIVSLQPNVAGFTSADGIVIQNKSSALPTLTATNGMIISGAFNTGINLNTNATTAINIAGANTTAINVSSGVTNLQPKLTIADSASLAPLNLTERNAFPTVSTKNDIYLDDGTNTTSGNPGWRRYTGSVWEDIGGGSATTFLSLSDTPISFSGQAGKALFVNAAESGLVFGSLAGGGTLDTAYDFGGAGAGRTITADKGAVEILTGAASSNVLFNIYSASVDPTARTLAIIQQANTGISAVDGVLIIQDGYGKGLTVDKNNSGTAVVINNQTSDISDAVGIDMAIDGSDAGSLTGQRMLFTSTSASTISAITGLDIGFNQIGVGTITNARAIDINYAMVSGAMINATAMYLQNHNGFPTNTYFIELDNASTWKSGENLKVDDNGTPKYIPFSTATTGLTRASEDLILQTTTSGDVHLLAATDLIFADGRKGSSTYSADFLLAGAVPEWNTFEINFGEVSLINAINQAATMGGSGSQTLAQTLVLGNSTGGNDIEISSGDVINATNSNLTLQTTVTGAINLVSAGLLTFDDAYRGVSTYSTPIMFSNASAEWNTFESNFGEVSILNALNQVAGGGGSLDVAYNNGSAITVDSTDVVWNLTATNDFKIQNGGSDAFVVDENGNIYFGNSIGGSATWSNNAFNIQKVPQGGSGGLTSMTSWASVNSSYTTTYIGNGDLYTGYLANQTAFDSTPGTNSGVAGFVAVPRHNSLGALPILAGYYFRGSNENADGSVTDMSGLVVENGLAADADSITNQYGVKIENLTSGVNDYGIYIAGADTYALWADAGDVRVDDDLIVGGNVDVDTLQSSSVISFLSNSDVDDYIYLTTASDTAYLSWSGTGTTINDPGFRVNTATQELEYRDEDEASWTSLDSLVGGSLSFFYGEMYQTTNSTATIINTANVWEEVDNFSSGVLNGWTHATGDLTASASSSGLYHLTYAVSATSASSNQEFEYAISVNDVIMSKCISKRKYASSDTGSNGGTCILSINNGDVVKLEVRNVTTASNVIIIESNVNLSEI